MSTKRTLARAGALVTVSGMAALLGSGTAAAHVTVNTGGEVAEKGGHAALTFRVPNEEPNADTVRLDVTFPKDTPISSAQTKPVPGWTAKVQTTRLDKPVTAEDGTKITEAVSKVTWTAKPGSGLGPEEYGEFDVSVALPDNTDRLVLPALQRYDNGEAVNWKTPPPADGKQEPEHPAPVIALSEQSENGHGGTVTAAQSDGGQQQAEADDSDTTARWLGGAGLVVGALGLGLGAGATMRARKSSGGSAQAGEAS